MTLYNLAHVCKKIKLRCNSQASPFFLLFAQDCRGMQNSTHARMQLDATESRAILSYVILTFRNSECRNDITKLRAKAIDLRRVGSKISLSATQAPLILWEVGLLITESLRYEKLVSKVNQRQPIQNAKYLRNHVEADRDLRSGATWLFFLEKFNRVLSPWDDLGRQKRKILNACRMSKN